MYMPIGIRIIDDQREGETQPMEKNSIASMDSV